MKMKNWLRDVMRNTEYVISNAASVGELPMPTK
jgi:hypothetical protein